MALNILEVLHTIGHKWFGEAVHSNLQEGYESWDEGECTIETMFGEFLVDI